MNADAWLEDRIEQVLGKRPLTLQPLFGGSTGRIYKAALPGTTPLVIKTDNPHCRLEARMIKALAAPDILPLPAIHYVDDDLLVMEYLPNDGRITASVEHTFGQALARFHALPQDSFGYEEDTTIGALAQPNPIESDWIIFFGQHRLLHRAKTAYDKGRLASSLLPRLEQLVRHLQDLVPEGCKPALLHGDIWSGNILCHNGQFTGLIDPAIYRGDPEIELAYLPLFGGFSQVIYDSYNTINPIDPDFYTTRRVLYQLWPLLVHVELYAGSYNESVDSHLRMLGF